MRSSCEPEVVDAVVPKRERNDQGLAVQHGQNPVEISLVECHSRPTRCRWLERYSCASRGPTQPVDNRVRLRIPLT